jgi:DNA-binding beta-propeller fold protein YncE
MTTLARMTYVVVVATFWFHPWNRIHSVAADETVELFQRPVAIAFDASNKTLLVANGKSGNIAMLQLDEGKGLTSPRFGNALKDLVFNPSTSALLAVVESPHRALLLHNDPGRLAVLSELDLSIVPDRIAISNEGNFACVTDRWNSRIELIAIDNLRIRSLGTQQLPWMPKEVVAFRRGFLVADAFDGSLAVVPYPPANQLRFYTIRGHHIGGLFVDQDKDMLFVTHQILSKTSHTTRDDIHWGSLMQNVVRSVPMSAFSDPNLQLDKLSSLYLLGDTGSGEADPSGLIADGDQLLVAASGSNHLVRYDMKTRIKKGLDVAFNPTRLLRIDEKRIAVVGTLADSVEIVNLDSFSMEVKYGGRTEPVSLELSGEIAFHSAGLSHDGWMSCSSCHVDGHAANVLADTQGDASFQSPKRVPSLLGNFSTAPFGWTGNKRTMDDQLLQTLETTMHTSLDDSSKQNAIQQLKAYLKTLKPPASENAEVVEREGKFLFESRGCSQCHRPDQQWTTAQVYDVGVHDEVGHRKFNPPTLLGLQYRKRFFHDARYATLAELLSNHPDPRAHWTDEELQRMQRFLWSLKSDPSETE